MIPPQELGKRTFARAVRGYEPSEVEQYVEFLTEKYTEIYNQCKIYHKKLEIVSQEILKIQEREDEMQNKEETIVNTMMSSQEIHDKKIEEARETADSIVKKAQETADEILADARERAQRAFAAVNKKTEEQIESAREQSDSLYLAARTRSAKLLQDLRIEIGSQRERLFVLKEAADNFNTELGEAYRKQFEAIKGIMVYTPAIDFEKLTETRLFNMIMTEVQADMDEIESKGGNIEYEFEKELMLLRDFDFADERVKVYKAGISGLKGIDDDDSEEADDNIDSIDEEPEYAENIENEAEDIEADDDDVKVFAGSTSAAESVGGTDAPDVPGSAAEDIGAEESIATYDSDDYQEENYSMEPDYSSASGMYRVDKDIDKDNDTDEDGDENSLGIRRFFKGFGKKKKAGKSKWDLDNDESDDIDDIYNELDDDDEDDEKVMNIFSSFDDDEEN